MTEKFKNKKAILTITKRMLLRVKRYLERNIKKGELPKNCLVLNALNIVISLTDDMKKI